MKIGEAERAFVVAEASGLAERLPDGEDRARYAEIARAAEDGEIPDHLEGSTGDLVALAIETGRAHAVHGAAGVRALLTVWKQSPRARAIAGELEELNGALSGLRGLPVEGVRVAASGPGAYSFTIAAGDFEMHLAVGRSGVRLQSVNVGGGGVGE
jgi:hypothetical protein